MDLKQILELLGQEHVAGDEMTGAFLEDAVAGFTANPAGATNSIRQLQASDPSGFVLAAVRLLTTREEKSAGVQYVAGLVFAGDMLIDALIDKRILGLEAATALARNLATAEPLLDARLVRKMLTNAAGDIRSVGAETALRVLALVETISDCARLSSYLVQLLRHPSAHVRSKVALLMGRSNTNLNRIKSFMASEDARLRANTIEALWGSREPQILDILRDAGKDRNGRVVINALVGLCRAGDHSAFERLARMAAASEPVVRAGVAWSMSHLGYAEECCPILDKLAEDSDEKVRAMVVRSRRNLEACGEHCNPACTKTACEELPGNPLPVKDALVEEATKQAAE